MINDRACHSTKEPNFTGNLVYKEISIALAGMVGRIVRTRVHINLGAITELGALATSQLGKRAPNLICTLRTPLPAPATIIVKE